MTEIRVRTPSHAIKPRTISDATPAEIAEADRAALSLAAADPVPCNGCVSCCKGDQCVVLYPDREDVEAYGRENLVIENYRGEMSIALKRTPSGDCVFLKDGRCSIYDHRPIVCRVFDCRRLSIALTRPQRKEAIRSGLYSHAIIAAGLQRRGSIHLQPFEEELYAPGGPFAEFVLGRRGMT